jgi:hypothetical protein
VKASIASAPSTRLPTMTPGEREVLERAIQRVTEQAANANAIVDEASRHERFVVHRPMTYG